MTRQSFNRTGALLAAVLMLFAALSPAVAAPTHRVHSAERKALTVLKTFRLAVVGDSARDTTYWVAYGPLNGRFGIVRLHPAGLESFQGTASLPARGRTTFSFLQGQGSVHSRAGWGPR